MKPRNREVNIFNMSVLDLLTGALGAFCFLTLALFPAYFKVVRGSSVEETKAARELKEIRDSSVAVETGPLSANGWKFLHRAPLWLEIALAVALAAAGIRIAAPRFFAMRSG